MLISPIDDILTRQPVLVLDGALATELERRGADLHDPLWSAKYLIEQPQMIRDVHFDYFEAGADVATTATYQATFEGFARRGLGADAAAQLMRDAVSLAIDARDAFWRDPANHSGRQRPLVAASVGPFGAMLADGSEYRGGYAAGDRTLREFHAPRLRVLAGSGADLLACETLPCLREALQIAELLREYPTLSVWMSFSARDAGCNSAGESIAECVAALEDYQQITAVGINCTRPEHVSGLLRAMRPRTSKHLLAYPNSGESYDASGKVWEGHADTLPFTEQARGWYADGARLLGGCCRTTPADISSLRGLALGV